MEMNPKEWLLALPRRYKRLLQVFTDVVLVWLALWFAFVVRLGLDYPIEVFGKSSRKPKTATTVPAPKTAISR